MFYKKKNNVISTLIAEHSTKTRLAVALPGSGASAVDAARVGVALVTVLAPPASFAPALTRLFAVAALTVARVSADS
jgi:hypothetical protein